MRFAQALGVPYGSEAFDYFSTHPENEVLLAAAERIQMEKLEAFNCILDAILWLVGIQGDYNTSMIRSKVKKNEQHKIKHLAIKHTPKRWRTEEKKAEVGKVPNPMLKIFKAPR